MGVGVVKLASCTVFHSKQELLGQFSSTVEQELYHWEWRNNDDEIDWKFKSRETNKKGIINRFLIRARKRAQVILYNIYLIGYVVKLLYTSYIIQVYNLCYTSYVIQAKLYKLCILGKQVILYKLYHKSYIIQVILYKLYHTSYIIQVILYKLKYTSYIIQVKL